jgi:hypothetical protein
MRPLRLLPPALWACPLVLLPLLLPGQQRFQVEFRLRAGASGAYAIRGSLPPLAWDRSLPLEGPDADGLLRLRLDFEAAPGQVLEYKFIRNEAEWELEGEGNRSLPLDSAQLSPAPALWNVLPPSRPMRIIPRAQLLAEAELIRDAYGSLHPGLFRSLDSAAWEEELAALRQSLDRDLSLAEAFLAYSRFLAAIRCGHTFCNPWNQGNEVREHILYRPDKLPFAFRILGRRMIVTENVSGLPALDGAEITHLGGVAVAAILDSLMTVVKADGANDAKRLYDLQVSGCEEYAWFDIYYPLFFPPGDSLLRVEGRRLADGEEFVETLRLVSPRTRRARIGCEGAGDWAFVWLDSSTALLRLPTFDTYSMELDWKAFLRDAFQELRQRGGQHLLLDIRGNEGGMDEVIYALARYLVKNPFRVWEWETRLRFDRAPERLRPYLSTWDESFYDFRGRVEPHPEGGFRMKRERGSLRVPAFPGAFRGEVYLLTDAGNSSATFLMARLMQAGQVATLAGQTTGGSLRGINGGVMYFFRLPYSGIEMDIPLFGNFPPSPQPDRGIQPDIEVPLRAEDFLAGRDAVIEAVLARIRGGGD